MEQKLNAILEELMCRYPSLENQRDAIWRAYEVLERSFGEGNKLLIAGNGGSASDAEHIVGELMKGFKKKRYVEEELLVRLEQVDKVNGRLIGKKLQGALPAISLVDHVALSTAFSNDVDSILGFAQQTNGYGNAGDVFWGISTSGNSKNILAAAKVAKAKGLKVIGLTGKDGGQLKDIADIVIMVNESETYKVQELHLPVYHTLCLMLEERFFDK